MSDRLTEDWTPTAEGAFGDKGKIGDRGELAVVQYFRDQGCEVIHYPDNYDKQTSGIDLEVDGVGFDVKTNLHKGKDVIVQVSTLLKSQATCWIHWNLEDPEDGPIVYKVQDMQDKVRYWRRWGRDGLVFVKRDDVP